MPSIPINIFTPEGGLNANLALSRIPDQDASETSNILYERGIMRTPFGFSIITSNQMPLPGSEPVHGLWQFNQISSQQTLVAVTRTKIFRRDLDADGWVDVSNASTAIDSNFVFPVSFVEVASTDVDPNYHLLVSDGGNSPIQRWAGETEVRFSDLDGGDDYHTQGGTLPQSGHYARQVGVHKNHIILMSPLIDEVGDGNLVLQPQQIRWSDTGKLETSWSVTGTGGAGFVLLLDTSDFNVRMALMGEVMIVYQQRSIWGIIFVGGSAIFDPRVLVQSVGLLAPGLLVSYRNVHYFVGNDFNVYEYFGGGVIRDISAPKSISDRLKDDLDATVVGHARMGMEAKGRRLHIGVVREGDNHIRRVYTRNMTTGAWGINNYDNYDAADKGVTTFVLAGSERSVIGETYDTLGGYGFSYNESFGFIPSSETNPDMQQCKKSHTSDISKTKPVSGSTDTSFWEDIPVGAPTGGSDWTATTTYALGDVVFDGHGPGDGGVWVCIKGHDASSVGASGDEPGRTTASTNEHLYWLGLDLPTINAITKINSTTFQVVFTRNHGLTSGDNVGDTITFMDTNSNPVVDGERTISSVVNTTTIQCTELNVATAPGNTGLCTLMKYRDKARYEKNNTKTGTSPAAADYNKYSDFFEDLLSEETMVIGDQAGNIYSFDETDTDWGGTNISASHETKEHDFGLPARRKRLQQIVVEAKGAGVVVGFSVDRESYTDFSARTLTDEFKLYRFFINRTGFNIRLRFKNQSGQDFQIRSYGFPNVQAQEFV